MKLLNLKHVWLTLGVLINCTPLFPQTITPGLNLLGPQHASDAPHFDLLLFNTAAETPNLSRLHIELTFINDELQFIKQKNKKFRADYQVTGLILNRDGTKVDSTSWRGFVAAQKFDETTSNAIWQSARGHIDLPPGEYRYRIGLTDLETRRAGVREGEVLLKDFSGEKLAVSDIVLFDKSGLEHANGVNNSGAQPDSSARVAYVEIYNTNEGDSLAIDYEILDSANQATQKGRQEIVSTGRITKSYLPVQKQVTEEKSRIKLNIQSADDTLHVELPLACNCQSGMVKNFDIAEAVEQLIYIAKKDEIKKLKAAAGEQQTAEFQKFWEKRDPTPGTRKNEYYEEYYRRIDFANKTFGGNKNGWRTDMGMVFVKLGQPDYIEKPITRNDYYDPISNRRPQVIWHYGQLQRRVIFRYEAGEYRIANLYEIFDLLNDEMRF